jgi:glycerol-3-phosphate dehydrogenase (NAD(P)+)
MSETVTIVGDGAMATLCSILLSQRGVGVRLYSSFVDFPTRLKRDGENKRYLPGFAIPDDLDVTVLPEKAFAGTTAIISAVPTQYIRGWWLPLAEHVPAGVPICSVAKGLENDTLLRPTQVIADVLAGGARSAREGKAGKNRQAPATEGNGGTQSASAGQGRQEPARTGKDGQGSSSEGDSSRPEDVRELAALSGPCIAPEVAGGLPATVIVAAERQPLAERLQDMFSLPHFRVYSSTDVVGLELAGATKNVIAIAAGILDGMEMGNNAKAALLTRGLVEITRLGEAMGARRETFAGLAGMGDLVTTCISPVGRNRSFGEAIGRGRSVHEALGATESVVEGVATTASVVEVAKAHDVEMPITRAIHRVLFEDRKPRDEIQRLMNRPLKSEADG